MSLPPEPPLPPEPQDGTEPSGGGFGPPHGGYGPPPSGEPGRARSPEPPRRSRGPLFAVLAAAAAVLAVVLMASGRGGSTGKSAPMAFVKPR
ncbi:hypothetical protein Scel_78140 [Streptomyces cellostaticus]|nr:hypothetical protein Scel_78140 [Streptomyces cellostaticus]